MAPKGCPSALSLPRPTSRPSTLPRLVARPTTLHRLVARPSTLPRLVESLSTKHRTSHGTQKTSGAFTVWAATALPRRGP